MRMFKHKLSGKHYRLVTQRESNINTYAEVDKRNNKIKSKAKWSDLVCEVEAIIIGFNNLVEVKQK